MCERELRESARHSTYCALGSQPTHQRAYPLGPRGCAMWTSPLVRSPAPALTPPPGLCAPAAHLAEDAYVLQVRQSNAQNAPASAHDISSTMGHCRLALNRCQISMREESRHIVDSTLKTYLKRVVTKRRVPGGKDARSELRCACTLHARKWQLPARRWGGKSMFVQNSIG